MGERSDEENIQTGVLKKAIIVPRFGIEARTQVQAQSHIHYDTLVSYIATFLRLPVVASQLDREIPALSRFRMVLGSAEKFSPLRKSRMRSSTATSGRLSRSYSRKRKSFEDVPRHRRSRCGKNIPVTRSYPMMALDSNVLLLICYISPVSAPVLHDAVPCPQAM